MSPKERSEKIEQMRKNYPAMFSHKNAKPNEVCIDIQPIDFAIMNTPLYREQGLSSVRMDDKAEFRPVQGIDGPIDHRAIFADLNECILLQHKLEQEKELEELIRKEESRK